MRAARSRLAHLQRETSPACREDPPGPSAPPSLPRLSLLLSAIVTHCDTSHAFYPRGLVFFFITISLCKHALPDLMRLGPCASRLFPATLPSLYKRADIKPKTGEGRGAANLNSVFEEGPVCLFIFLSF